MMCIIRYFWLLLLLVSAEYLGQHPIPFSLNAKTEVFISGIALPMSGVSIILDKKMKPLTEEQIRVLDANDVNKFDRFTTNNFDLKIANRSDWTLNTSILLGLSSNFIAPVVFNKDSYGKQLGTLGVIWLETNMVNFGLTELAKTIIKRNRPFLYGGQATDKLKYHKDARKSFFSGHTSFTATNSFYIASVFTQYQKGNKWNPIIWGGAALPPLLAAIQRVRAGKHFPTDVITGYIVGAACGIFIPMIHQVDPNVGPKSSANQPMGSPKSGLNIELIHFTFSL